jgi:hypothetical protein
MREGLHVATDVHAQAAHVGDQVDEPEEEHREDFPPALQVLLQLLAGYACGKIR